jgi:tetratricopeptide (TPR) repeat protein
MWARRAFRLSARTGNDYYHVCVSLLYLRHDDVTRQALEEAQRWYPTDQRIQIVLAMLELLRNQNSEALMRIREAADRAPGNDEVKLVRVELAFLAAADDARSLGEAIFKAAPDGVPFMLPETPRVRYAFLLAKTGDADGAAPHLEEAERIARGSLSVGRDSPWVLIELAAVSAIRGDSESAMEWLDRAYAAGHRDYGFLERDPIFDSLHADARFRELLERMKTDVATMRRRAAEQGLLDLATLSPAAAAPKSGRLSRESGLTWLQRASTRGSETTDAVNSSGVRRLAAGVAIRCLNEPNQRGRAHNATDVPRAESVMLVPERRRRNGSGRSLPGGPHVGSRAFAVSSEYRRRSLSRQVK